MSKLKQLGWFILFAVALSSISQGIRIDEFWVSIIGYFLIGIWLSVTWQLIEKRSGDDYRVYFTGLSKEELDRAREYVERNIERNSRRSNPAHRKGTARISEERPSGSPYQSESGSED